MAVTQNNYTGDGSTVLYNFTFPYLATTDIKVKLDGVDTTAYSFANATTVQMNSAPANGAKVIIYRNTNNDNKKATFYPGSSIKAEDLNNNYDQILYVAQEVDNNAMSTLGDTAMQGDFLMGPGFGLQFEGSTDDDNETRLVAADPTADRTITLPNVTGNVVTTGDTGTVTDAMLSGGTALTSAEKTKLAGIETGATGDQTNAEIKAAVEAASDSNVFTDADHSKLNAIEASATADQTAAEIRTLVGNASDSNVFTDADHTKLDGIATSANNYTHPNHSGEVTSTADGATVIASNIVDEDNLKISNAGSNGQYLQKQSGNTGGLTWADGPGAVGGATGVDFNDAVKVRLGSSNELELYHSGTNAYIVDNGAGDLWIKNTAGDDLFLQSVDDIHIRPQNGEDGIKVIGNGAVELYYDGSTTPKLKTTSIGVEVNSTGTSAVMQKWISNTGSNERHVALYSPDTDDTSAPYTFYTPNSLAFKVDTGAIDLLIHTDGNVQIPNDTGKLQLGTSQDLQIYSDGSNSWIKHDGDGSLYINAAGTSEDIYIRAADNVYIQTQTSESAITAVGDGGVDLYYDGDRKFKTITSGAEVESSSGDTQLVVHAEHDDSASDAIFKAYTQNNQANCYLMFGDNDDTFVGGFKYENNGDQLVFFTNNAAAWYITSDGHFRNNSDTRKIQFGASEDFSIYHDGSHSYIDETGQGNLYIKSSGLWLRDGGDGGIQNLDGTENHIQWHANGNVELYYDGGTPKLQTTSTGVSIAGDSSIDGNLDLGGGVFIGTENHYFYRDSANRVSLRVGDTSGTHTYGSFANRSGVFAVGCPSGDLILEVGNESTPDQAIKCINNNAVELNFDGAKKFETTSPGVSVTGDISISGSIDEHVYNCTGTALDPSNGTMQYKTLGANTTLTESIASGESMLLMVADGSSYTVTWPTMTWVGGSAPTLATSGYSCIELWKISSTLYGCHIGDVA